MPAPLRIEEVVERLDRLAAELTRGDHQHLDEQTAQMAPCVEALEGLAGAARQKRAPPGAADHCRQIRGRIAGIHELLAYAQQVRATLAGIVNLRHQPHNGAQYSARGSPDLVSVPKIRVSG